MVKATGDNSKKKKRSMNSSTHQMSTTSKARKTKDDQATMGHNPTTKRKQEPMNRKERKEIAKERKSKRQKNFHVIQEATALWEKLRQSRTPKQTKQELVPKILELCGDRIPELAVSHTASRIIQSCVKYGSEEDRMVVHKHMVEGIVEISKSPYGRFVVSKLISTAQKEQLAAYIKGFKGRAPELLRHPAGTHVLDDLYCAMNHEQRAMIAAEFYGKEYSLFANGTLNNTKGAPDTLEQLLAAVDGQKKLSIIKHIASTITPVIEKGLVDNQLAHRLIMEYLKSASPSLVEDAVETLSGEHLLHMIHTHEGAEAACMVIAYGSAKDRKKSIRAFKGHVLAAVMDEWGYLPIATALSVTDDTALLKKVIISEMQGQMPDLIKDKHAHKVLLQVLSPYSPRYFPPSILDIMKPKAKHVETKVKEDDSEPSTSTLGASKKDSIVRRREILEGGFGELVCEICMESTKDLITAQYSSDVMLEMCTGSEGNILDLVLGESVVDTLHKNVIDVAKEEEVLNGYFSSRALRRMVLASSKEGAHAAKRFVPLLWKSVLKGKCKKLIDTHAAKIVAAMVDCGCPDVQEAVQKELKQSVPDWASKFVPKSKK